MSKINLYSYTHSEKDSVLRGVYHDPENESAVATDGIVMIVDKTQYIPDYAGKVIDKEGNIIPAKYPDYQRFIPKDKDLDHDLDLSAITNDSIRAAKKCENSFNNNGVRREYCGRGTYYIDCPEVGINPRYGELLMQFGLEGWKTPKYKVGYGPIVKKTDDITILLMPMSKL